MNSVIEAQDEFNRQQWEQYYAEKAAFDKRMTLTRPKPEDYGAYIFTDGHVHWGYNATPGAYARALNAWNIAVSCDQPNPPGYERAHND